LRQATSTPDERDHRALLDAIESGRVAAEIGR
jgi:hypothetical protein